jgi:hypothetical protein
MKNLKCRKIIASLLVLAITTSLNFSSFADSQSKIGYNQIKSKQDL